jgi:hypothetical protein
MKGSSTAFLRLMFCPEIGELCLTPLTGHSTRLCCLAKHHFVRCHSQCQCGFLKLLETGSMSMSQPAETPRMWRFTRSAPSIAQLLATLPAVQQEPERKRDIVSETKKIVFGG